MWDLRRRRRAGSFDASFTGDLAVKGLQRQHQSDASSNQIHHHHHHHHLHHFHFPSFFHHAQVFKKDFYNHYQFRHNSIISRGTYATVTVASNNCTDVEVAVKIISKAKLVKQGQRCAGEDVNVEVQALQRLTGQHNVVRYIDAYEDEEFIYIVMELCRGGSLLERVNLFSHFEEQQAKRLLRQMLEITYVCHSMGISHRDLKLENFVFLSRDDDSQLKLVDFGSAAFFRQGDKMPFKRAAGTFIYMAPEAFSSPYGPPADVWSLGVIAYTMLSGKLPFGCDSNEGLKERVLYEEVKFSEPLWSTISHDAKSLVKEMLMKTPGSRISVSQALVHSWFKESNVGHPGA